MIIWSSKTLTSKKLSACHKCSLSLPPSLINHNELRIAHAFMSSTFNFITMVTNSSLILTHVILGYRWPCQENMNFVLSWDVDVLVFGVGPFLWNLFFISRVMLSRQAASRLMNVSVFSFRCVFCLHAWQQLFWNIGHALPPPFLHCMQLEFAFILGPSHHSH